MIILGIESSAVSAGAAVIKDGKLMGECYLNVGLTHSETLMQLVDSCLKNAGLTVAEVDAFAVAAGPGSFTGVRIGISAVKGMAFGGDKPVYGVSTLEALACGALIEGKLIVPVMDARCRQVYTAAFVYENGSLVRRAEDAALPLDTLYEFMKQQNLPVLLLGDGAKLTAAFLQEKNDVPFGLFPEIFQYQHASGVAFAAYLRYNNGEKGLSGDALLPSYLRLPQAERERMKGEQKK